MALFLQAQHPVFRHFTIDDGLPSSEIYHIFQDSKGYIWIATNMGVSRYDGNKFTNFDKQDGLAENTVFEVYEDGSGRVWFVSFPCQLSYYYDGVIHEYRYNDVLKTQIGGYAVPFKFSFTVSDNEVISLGLMYEGLISIDKNGKLTKLHPSGKASRSVHLYVKNNKVLVSQGKDMDLSNLTIHRDGSIKKFYYYDRPMNYTHGQMMAVINGRDQIVFMQNNLLASFSENGEPETRYMDYRIFGIYPDHKNNIWVATDKNGVFCFEDGNITSKPIQHLLKDVSISAVFQDTEAGMWFATFTDGIFYLPYGSFSSYTVEEGLSSNNVNTIALRNKEVILGTNDEFINILSDNKIKQTRISITENDRIQAMNIDSDESIWIGTVEYLYKVNQAGEIVKFSNTKNKLSSNAEHNERSRNIFSIKTITNSVDKGIWLGESNAFSKFKNNELIYNSLVVDSVGLRTEALLQLDDGTLYIGSMNGLWKFNNNEFFYLGKVNSLLSNRITDIKYSTKNDLLFIGTKGSGLLVYNLRDSVYQIFKSHGLSSNSISSLLLLGDYLWIGTNYGLNVL
ncbi:MAG: hypothetical protein HGA37_01370, partial [Lentimicrobium sp.]|nr:hypothetical protein [Lentimicrobium sp.]